MPVAPLSCPEDFWPPLMQVEATPGGGGTLSYSSAGLMMLGLIIKQVTGRSCFDEIQDHAFDRAAMRLVNKTKTKT